MNQREPINPNVCLICDPAARDSAEQNQEGPGDAGEMTSARIRAMSPQLEVMGA